ncbi:MAG: DUF1631 family protein [Burkholderiales bacterium]|nr:DUF1631 family protein [Burkholderiales bacterium]
MTATAAAPPAKSLLSECREIARSRLAEVVAAALAKIDEDLFQLADKSIKRDEQQVYLEAMTRVRQHRGEIQRKFEDCFRNSYDKRLDAGRAAAANADKSGIAGLELSLVSDSIIETGIALDRLAKNVMSSVDNNEMLGIRARLGHLLNRESLDDAENPLSPETIFEALKLACNHIPAEDSVKQALLAAFQPYLSRSISQVYAAVNQSLIAHHVLPRIKHVVRTTADPMGVSQRMMGMSSTQRMNALSQSGRMNQLDPNERTGWLGGSMGNEALAIGALLSGLAQGQTAARVDGLRFLTDAARFPAGTGEVAPSATLLESLAQLQSEANLGAAGGFLAPGYLRELDRAMLAQGTPLDQLTIELVSIVFDYLNNNARIAEPIKGVIARLQIVAVKAAILDRSFFARRAHPMRRLLDRMAEAGGDPAITLAEPSAFLNGLRHLIDDLAVQFKDDVAVFERALEELEHLIALEHERGEAAARAQAHALAAQEALAAADAAAHADLAQRITATTPDFIRYFLAGPWVKAVADAQAKGSGGEDSVAARLNLAADLIWSIEPKSRTDIPVLAGMLPKLVRGLMRGVIPTGMPEDDRQAFFNRLMKAHTEAIAAAKAATVELPSQPLPSSSGVAPELKPVPLVVAKDVYDHTALDLTKGESIAFSDQSADDRYRVTWISPKRTFFLFTNGKRMRQMSAASLSTLLRQGKARLIEGQAPVIDSAIEALSADQALPMAA